MFHMISRQLNRNTSLFFIIFVGSLLWSFTSVFASDNSVEYKVKSSDSLSSIVNSFYKASKLNKQQIMIGVLAENPKAFRRGNVNALMSNQTLHLPKADSLQVMDAKDASHLIAKHNDHLLEGVRKPLDPPFVNRPTITKMTTSAELDALVKAQNELQTSAMKLDKERAALQARVIQLLAEKERVDAELEKLDIKVEK